MKKDVNIGKTFTLKVVKAIENRGKHQFVVESDAGLVRVDMLDSQIGQPIPHTIKCVLRSINEFGFPKFEQEIPQQRVNLVGLIRNTAKNILSGEVGKAEVPDNSVSHSSLPKKSTNRKESNLTALFWQSDNQNFKDWFIKTGGVKARYDILLQLAKLLFEYHSQNKIYKDLIPEYIKVKQAGDNYFVILPQTQNFSVGYDDSFIYASYCAPEVVTRRMPNTQMSDCFAFAIIVHQLLNFCHPFFGDEIIGGNQKMMRDAVMGKLPWIGDSKDNSNCLSKRYYKSLFTSKEIDLLLNKTFEVGKENVLSRPTMANWCDAINRAQFEMTVCPECRTSYLRSKSNCCPFCKSSIDINAISIELGSWVKCTKYNSSENLVISKMMFVSKEQEFKVDKNNPLILNSSFMFADFPSQDILRIEMENRHDDSRSIIITPLNNIPFYAANENGNAYSGQITERTRVIFNKSRKMMLSLSDLTHEQRVLKIY
jgi:hypothetical protein